jgi:hypothetical protein
VRHSPQVIELPLPNPPLYKGRGQESLVSPLYKGGLRGVILGIVRHSLQVIELPLPNPPLIKGRGQESLVSPLYKGGLRGVILGIISTVQEYENADDKAV